MFQSVIVPLDGSQRSEDALPYAQAIAARTGATLTLLRVVTQDGTAQEQEQVRAYLDARAQALGQAGGGVQTSLRLGRPDRQIIAAAQASQDPLIVMAADVHHGLGGLLHESMSAQLVHDGRVPVLTIRSAPSGAVAISKILVPLDGSAFAESALPYAESLAQAFGAELHVISVAATTQVYGMIGTDPLAPASGAALNEITEDMIDETRTFIKREGERLQQAGYPVQAQALIGDPANQILAYAREREIDLIVMATHGRGGFQRVFFGSVAQQILHETTTPLLLSQPRGELREEPHSRAEQSG